MKTKYIVVNLFLSAILIICFGLYKSLKTDRVEQEYKIIDDKTYLITYVWIDHHIAKYWVDPVDSLSGNFIKVRKLKAEKTLETLSGFIE